MERSIYIIQDGKEESGEGEEKMDGEEEEEARLRNQRKVGEYLRRVA